MTTQAKHLEKQKCCKKTTLTQIQQHAANSIDHSAQKAHKTEMFPESNRQLESSAPSPQLTFTNLMSHHSNNRLVPAMTAIFIGPLETLHTQSHHDSIQLILWGPWMYVSDFMVIHPWLHSYYMTWCSIWLCFVKSNLFVLTVHFHVCKWHVSGSSVNKLEVLNWLV